MKKVFEYLENTLKLKDGDTIIIGNSTGPDSMALMDILLKIREKKKINIICAHVNHNLREQSKEEESFIIEYCKEKKVVLERMKIEKYGDDNFHNEARTIRYNFFENLVKKYNANYLMTAHHGDDLIETILMRIVRGSTLRGYAGFKPLIDKGEYKLVRPLIFVTKEELEKYDKKNNMTYFIDKSNFKGTYTRNRYRKTVLPFLKEEDKNVHEKFLKFSTLLNNYEDFVDKQVKKVYSTAIQNETLDLEEYNKQEELIKDRLISKMLEAHYQDDLMLINDTHLSLIKDLIKSNKKNAYITLPNDVRVTKEYNKLSIKYNIEEVSEYEIEFDDYAKLPNGHEIVLVTEASNNDNSICRIDTTDVKMPLYIRTRKDGDRIKLKKLDGYKKIKDVFIDSKVELSKRDKWPIVVDSNGEIIWIPGIKKSKFTKSKTEKCDIILKYQ